MVNDYRKLNQKLLAEIESYNLTEPHDMPMSVADLAKLDIRYDDKKVIEILIREINGADYYFSHGNRQYDKIPKVVTDYVLDYLYAFLRKLEG